MKSTSSVFWFPLLFVGGLHPITARSATHGALSPECSAVRGLIGHGADVNAQPGMGPDSAFIFGGGRSALMALSLPENSETVALNR